MKTKNTTTPAASTNEAASNTVSFGVRFVSADDASLSDRINYAIQHNGMAIYNGNDETETVPFVALLSLIFFRYDPKADEFEGEFGTFGSDAERVTVIDFAFIAADKRSSVLRQHLDASTLGCWAEHRNQFDDDKTIAVRIDDADGETWYEMIINTTK